MGSKSSVEVGPPEGPIVDIMRRKYEDKSLKYLNVWTAEFGFPIGGSLSLKNISILEEKLKKKEQEMRRKNTISVRKLENIEDQKKCLQMWKGEAEMRSRKTVQKQLPFPCEYPETNEKQISHTKGTQDSQTSSLFPQLAALKLDPDLDGSPPIHLSAPPPYNTTTPNQGRETNSITPQTSTGAASPIAHRLRNPNQDAAFNMPMVEVSGPEGTTLVFRPWTSADITAASQHLPSPTTSGKMFAEQFSTFCQEFKPTVNELKRLLITKMKPTDWQKIAGKFPDADIRCKHITWEHESNAHYRDVVRLLCDAFIQAFPVKINMEKITACKQKDNENPDEYLTRLTEVFNTYSGLQLPDEPNNVPDVWEIHLCNSFLSGLKPDIASAVKSSCIGWNDARLSELRRHAIHAHDQILSKKKKKEETTQKELHMAAMTMYNTVQGREQPNHEQKGRAQGRHRHRKRPTQDACFICGQYGHWKNECPRKTSSIPVDKSD
uniref:uncharacterized protein LOC124066281 n=1 Tax=Scatophagus argus TaxID=75038 RepID=UPI001ED7CFBD|nr:uncharacterized protein LOC124066281 [Scatophagus argus]